MQDCIPLSDEELVRIAQMGKHDAFTQLYERYLRNVYQRVRLKIPEEEVEDITQEIFIAIMKSLNSFRGQSKFSTWVWTLTNRRIADYYRARRRSPAEVEELDQTNAGSILNTDDEILVMRSALCRLPENYQEIILMRFVDGLSFEEIASRNGQSLDAAKSLFRRAVVALRKEMVAANG